MFISKKIIFKAKHDSKKIFWREADTFEKRKSFLKQMNTFDSKKIIF